MAQQTVNLNENEAITMTQKEMIYESLLNGVRLTHLQAEIFFGCSKISTRIGEIAKEIKKDKLKIYRRTITLKTKFGKKRQTQYSLYPFEDFE
jgi:hypothetical protein